MNINIKATGVTLTASLQDYTEKKIASIERYLKGTESVLCDIELAQPAKHQTGPFYSAEVTMEVDGTLFRATAQAESLEAAVDMVRDEVVREIRDVRKKKQDMVKRGGKRAKELLRTL